MVASFVVEDGTGLSNANAYISVQEFRDYHDSRGADTSGIVDDRVQVLIVQATDYIDTRFRFIGTRQREGQALDWPRVDAYRRDGSQLAGSVPREVKKACAEYAFRANSNPLAPDPVIQANNGVLQRERVEVDQAVSRDLTYNTNVGFLTFRPYPLADGFLEELIVSGNRLLRV